MAQIAAVMDAFTALTKRAATLAIRRAEIRLHRQKGEGRAWRNARLLWPLFSQRK